MFCRVKKVFSFFYLATHHQYQRRGIAKSLTETATQWAKERGYEAGVTLVSSSFNRNMLEKYFNFEILQETDYKGNFALHDFMSKEMKDNHFSCMLMAKKF